MSQTNAATRTGAPAQPGRLARLRWSSFGLVTMLILEFILGAIYSLYGTAPTAHKSIGLFSSPDLALHVILGILLVLAAVMQVVRAVGTRHRLAITLSAVGLVAIIGPASPGSGSPAAARQALRWAWPCCSRSRWPATWCWCSSFRPGIPLP